MPRHDLPYQPRRAVVRNAQRLVERVRQLGAGGSASGMLNRVSDQHLIAPADRAGSATDPPHVLERLRTVSTALNSGVPLALTNHSELASQFDNFTRQLVGLAETPKPEPEKKRVFLGMF